MNKSEDLDLLSEREIRINKVKFLEKNASPYPHASIKKISTITALNLSHDSDVVIAGRVMSMRKMGKMIFFDIQDQEGKIQCVYRAPDIGLELFQNFSQYIDRGDILKVNGNRFITKKGEESIMVKNWLLLSKCIRPLPDKFNGLKNPDIRYRKRYLDLITDRQVFDRFRMRSKILEFVRQFLNSQGFMEVETPTLQSLYGGTNAKPFTTHINAYDMDMFLRVAPELYLKRLVIGGYERVYEIGKNFRNEGVDQTHNPEFTMIEWYEAYADYQDIMDRAEKLYKYIAKQLFGEIVIFKENKKINLDYTWEKVCMTDIVLKQTNFDVFKIDEETLSIFCKKNNIEYKVGDSRGKILYQIFDNLVAPTIVGPLWVIDYPQEISPLSRAHRSKKGFVERFECYFDGKELGDGWTEITSPFAQRDRFENEQKAMRAGNEESHPMDEDFLEALEYGMPPLGGIGIGIDRLVMFFTGVSSIREVLFFPFMRPNDVLSRDNNDIN